MARRRAPARSADDPAVAEVLSRRDRELSLAGRYFAAGDDGQAAQHEARADDWSALLEVARRGGLPDGAVGRLLRVHYPAVDPAELSGG